MHGSVHCQVWIEGGGGLENGGYSSPPPSPARRVGREATLKSPSAALSTQPNTRWSPAQTHAVRRLPPRFIRGGSPLPGPRPARPPPLSVLKQKEKTEGQGAAVPGDFTLFEASVFHRCRCHPRRFSLLLHRHLPPSPAGGQASRGRGSLPAEDSSGLAPASHRQQQAKEQSCQPAPERRSPAAARSQVPCPSFSAQSRGGSPPAGTSADHTGKRTPTAPHRRQSHTTTGRSAA